MRKVKGAAEEGVKWIAANDNHVTLAMAFELLDGMGTDDFDGATGELVEAFVNGLRDVVPEAVQSAACETRDRGRWEYAIEKWLKSRTNG